MFNNCKVLFDEKRYMEIIDLLNPEMLSIEEIPKYCVYYYLWSLYRLYLSKHECQKNTSEQKFDFVISEMRRLAPKNKIFANIIDRELSSRSKKNTWSIDEDGYSDDNSNKYSDFDDIAAREQGNM